MLYCTLSFSRCIYYVQSKVGNTYMYNHSDKLQTYIRAYKIWNTGLISHKSPASFQITMLRVSMTFHNNVLQSPGYKWYMSASTYLECIPCKHTVSVTWVNRLTSRSMILTLREVLTKRHYILKARLRLWTRDEGTRSQSDRLWICKTDAVIA